MQPSPSVRPQNGGALAGWDSEVIRNSGGTGMTDSMTRLLDSGDLFRDRHVGPRESDIRSNAQGDRGRFTGESDRQGCPAVDSPEQ